MNPNLKQHKSSFFTSINFKIILITFLSVAVALALAYFIMISGIYTVLNKMTSDTVMNSVTSYSQTLNLVLGYSESNTLSEDVLTKILSSASLDGITSSYAYIVDSDGTMLYHPTASKIGASVENSVVKALVSDIQNGNIPEPNVVTYDFNGVIKYAGYEVLPSNHWILVISADQDEIFSTLNQIQRKTLVSCIFLAVCIGFIGFILARTISRPIRLLTKSIVHISNLDFQDDPVLHRLSKRSDETGEMSQAIFVMKQEIHKAMADIMNTSNLLAETAKFLHENMSQVTQNSSDNSATTEQLAAGMEETSATSADIQTHIDEITSHTKEIQTQAMEEKNNAISIQQNVDALEKDVQKATQNASLTIEKVRGQSETAIENAKGVEKINVLANSIMSITKQTSLLALNASIEAARAGEAGKGFAVVAQEITHLSAQSSNTIGNITSTIKEVHDAVSNLTECLQTALNFLQTEVLNDYTRFVEMSGQYHKDAYTFEKSLSSITDSMTKLMENTMSIASAIEGINTTIGESAVGINDVAEKTGNIVTLASQTYDMVEKTFSHARLLEDIVNKFKL